jgi:Phosphotransferase enzyme family
VTAAPGQTDRAAYLAEVCGLLWPEPAQVSLSRIEQDATSEFIVLPAMRRPRLVVPAGRRAAAAAVRRYGEPGSARAWLAVRALSLGLASGAGGVVLRDRLRVRVPAGAATIETYLRDQLGRDVSVSMHLGAARANRKPVLQLLTGDGETAGFAKIGVSPLTSRLVQAERDALTRLDSANVSRVAVPRVLHFGSWRGLTVMVLSPLPVWRRRAPLTSGRLGQAMREVAGITGISRGPLCGGAYWQSLGTRIAGADDTQDARALREALEAVRGRAGDAELSFGAWHGDWTPWNMASTRGGLLVWDWERFTAGVPLGFDVLHHWLQVQVISRRRDPRLAASDCVDRAPALLAPLEIGAYEARLTALMYVADLAARYLADRQAEAGARLGVPGNWLIPALADRSARL